MTDERPSTTSYPPTQPGPPSPTTSQPPPSSLTIPLPPSPLASTAGAAAPPHIELFGPPSPRLLRPSTAPGVGADNGTGTGGLGHGLSMEGDDERARWLSTASARTSFTRVDRTRSPTPTPSDPADSDPPAQGGGENEPPATAAEAPAAATPAPPAEESVPQTPQAAITFLLVTGRRRTMTFDPTTNIGRVKELVWNTWPADWQDERPPTPSHLRILYLGRVLQDEESLQTELKLPAQPALVSSTDANKPPTIVHLSIRAFAPAPEDDGKKRRLPLRRGSTAGGGDPQPGESGTGGMCCCAVC